MSETGSDLGEGAWDEQMAELWARHRPAILKRIAVLEQLVATTEPRPEQIEASRIEAHKLRGLLGTIGLPAGSDVAGEIEDLLAAGEIEISDPLAQLRTLVCEHAA